MAIKDLKVGTRMSLGFSVVLLLMLTTMTATFFSLQKVETSTNHVIEESLPFTLLADRMELNAVSVQQYITDAAVTHDVSVLNEAKSHYQEFKSGAEKFKTMFREENDTAHLQEMDELMADMDKVLEDGERMVLAYTNEGKEAGNVIMKEFDADVALLTELLDEFHQVQVAEIHEQTELILTLATQVKTLQVILGAIALVIGVFITIFITRSIVKPLEVAVKTARALCCWRSHCGNRRSQ